MRTTFPVITCDHEGGCTAWTHDWFSALASNWRDIMEKGWQYDPFKPDAPQLCPDHAPRKEPK